MKNSKEKEKSSNTPGWLAIYIQQKSKSCYNFLNDLILSRDKFSFILIGWILNQLIEFYSYSEIL